MSWLSSRTWKGSRLSAISEQLSLRGSIVSLWAGIESGIDQTNHALLILTDGKATRKLPRNFSEKTSFLQENLPLAADFAEFHSVGIDLVERVMHRIEDRHYLVHGYTLQSLGTDDSLQLRKHRLKKVTIESEDRQYTLRELRAFNDESLTLSNDWADLISQLAAKIARVAAAK